MLFMMAACSILSAMLSLHHDEALSYLILPLFEPLLMLTSRSGLCPRFVVA